MRDSRYIEIPGNETHELPPLLVHAGAEFEPGMEETELFAVMGEAEDMLGVNDAAPEALEERKFELALQLKEQYRNVLRHWHWGDSVLDWIRQCEITFEHEAVLRSLLHPDVWPHASRASFVTLLIDKEAPTRGVALDHAVGLRLTFRQPPPIDCFSNQFLFFLNPSVAGAAYRAWSRLSADQASLLPPERFHFDVLDLDG